MLNKSTEDNEGIFNFDYKLKHSFKLISFITISLSKISIKNNLITKNNLNTSEALN